MKDNFFTVSTVIFVLTMAPAAIAQSPNFAGTKPAQNPRVEVEFVGNDPVSTGKPAGKITLPVSEGSLPSSEVTTSYTVGVDDILEISVLQPEKIQQIVSVAPDGTVVFPYIGTLAVRGLTLQEIQAKVHDRLAADYMKYPLVMVTLQQSRSRNFFVYGEVTKPGAYPLQENTTVLRAISMAGGFTKFGSSARVRVLRPRENEPGYEPIRIDLRKLMSGSPEDDILLKPGDMVVVSEGMF